MGTRLSRYADGLMEAAWLAAVVAVPLFFNVYSSRIFEPDKITLLRTLALVILAAWIVKVIEMGGIHWERVQLGEGGLKSLLQLPLILPVAALAAVYLIATIFSITPRVSFLGSYQRLQGTYTTLSYLVLFAAIAANLRHREQIERLVSVIILTSLPVSLYGVLQRYQLDPIPWGGDVSVRIASNMGNSIFVAAYLIMVFPLTLYRIVESFGSILKDQGSLVGGFSRSTAYVFIAALQLIALFLTGSRGPWLGWMASVFFILVLLSLLWRKRWMTWSVVGLAVLGAGSLALLNVSNGPLESVRALPGVGRLGQLLDAESRTGRVRTLIWKGASELVLPHEPLKYPDGRQDVFNLVRPLVGYGPESMYVAYNPFYPPELTQVEKRNASPDRSHNETWDVLVRTGVLGLVVYLTLFGSVFYYGLKWLGLVTSHRQRNLFLGLYFGFGILSALGLVLWRGVGLFGVGLPFGMIIGVLVYLILASISGTYRSPETVAQRLRALTIMALLAAVVAHFVEVNFGIAIAATRTYFWVYAALLLVVGYVFSLQDEYERVFAEPDPSTGNERSNRFKRRGRVRKSGSPDGLDLPWLKEGLLNGFLIALILVPLGYNYLTNRQSADSVVSLIWTSLTVLPTLLNSTVSYGILALVVMAWLAAGVVVASESDKLSPGLPWVKLLSAGLGISLLLAILYWGWHAAGLITIARSSPQDIEEVLSNVQLFEGLLSRYYLYYFALILGLAWVLPREWPLQSLSASRMGVIAVPVLLAAVFYLGSVSNLRIIQADIVFKVGDSFANRGSYPAAIAVYDRAIDLAPNEDYYYLFLGRAYLEYGRSLDDPAQREQLFARAKTDLEKAQKLNPLNTDHTANLGRLYSLWASLDGDPTTRQDRGELSTAYFSQATILSPNNARLWDEWAILYLNVFQQPDQAYQRFMRALEIDPNYDWTYALLGDYYVQESQDVEGPQKQEELLSMAASSYRQALELISPRDTQNRYSYYLALAGTYAQLGQPEGAISAYEGAIEVRPEDPNRWRIEEALGKLYLQVADRTNAYTHLAAALSLAPSDQTDRLRDLVSQLQAQQ